MRIADTALVYTALALQFHAMYQNPKARRNADTSSTENGAAAIVMKIKAAHAVTFLIKSKGSLRVNNGKTTARTINAVPAYKDSPEMK